MLLSIIIPAWNEEKLLPETLAAIRAAAADSLTRARIDWELIVCGFRAGESNRPREKYWRQGSQR